MYLAELSDEQKRLFFDLSLHAMHCNGIMADEEKAMIKAYCKEMEMEFEAAEPSLGLEAALAKLAAISDKSTLTKISVELIAEVMSDNSFDAAEKAFVDKVCTSFGLSDKEISNIIFATQHLTMSYWLLNKLTE